MKFITCPSGNFGVIFAILLLPVALSIGMATDYTMMSNKRSEYQNFADAAALAGAREVAKTDEERKNIAKDFFLAQVGEVNQSEVDVDLEDDLLTVKVSHPMQTSFMGLIGMKQIQVEIESVANIAVKGVEIAFVLDVSGSMSATFPNGVTRLQQMKTSAKSLVAQIESSAGDKGKVAIVPFTMNVNVGKSNSSFVYGTNSPLFDGTEWMGCVQERGFPKHVANEPGTKLHAYAWPPAPNGGQCKNPSDGSNSAYGTLAEINFKGTTDAQHDGPNRNCVRHEMSALTSNYSAVNTKIDSLDAPGNDGTIIAPGVTWGLRILSPEAPFSEGADWNHNTRKVMVILTDGEQTTEVEFQNSTCESAKNSSEDYSFDPKDFGMSGKKLASNGPHDNWTPYGYIMDSDPLNQGVKNEADLPNALSKLSLAACDEAKKAKSENAIEIYTIGVSAATAPGTEIYNLLNKCASKPENHFFVENATELENAFADIAKEVTELQLTQ